MQLDDHILLLLASGRPLTLGDVARRFGCSTAVARLAARRLVDSGQAEGVLVQQNGVEVLRGLRAPAKAAAEA